MPGDTSPQRCIFCGGTVLTQEHIVADWVVRAFLRSRKTRSDFSGDFLSTSEMRLSTGPPAATARLLCRACNNEWVSAIDNDAARALRPLINGRAEVELDPDQQRAVAAWVFKSALIFDASSHGDQRLAGLAPAFAADRAAPPGVTIWMGPSPATPFSVPGVPQVAGLALFGVRRVQGQVNLTINVEQPDGSVVAATPSVIPTRGWAVMLGRMEAIISSRRGPIIPTPEFRYACVWPAGPEPVTLTSVPPASGT